MCLLFYGNVFFLLSVSLSRILNTLLSYWAISIANKKYCQSKCYTRDLHITHCSETGGWHYIQLLTVPMTNWNDKTKISGFHSSRSRQQYIITSSKWKQNQNEIFSLQLHTVYHECMATTSTKAMLHQQQQQQQKVTISIEPTRTRGKQSVFQFCVCRFILVLTTNVHGKIRISM